MPSDRNLQRVDFDNFSGGIREESNLSPLDFTERQWSQIDGFVLEDEVSLRAQWALQPISNFDTNFREVRPFKTRYNNWLVGIKVDGTIWYVKVPVDNALSSTTAALRWISLGSFANNSNRRFLCEINPYKTPSGENRAALIANTVFLGDPVIYIYEKDDQTGLTFDAKTNYYANTEANADGIQVPVSNVHPHANQGIQWNGYLVLGDVVWFKDPSTAQPGEGLTPQNTKRYSNLLHFSVPGALDAFDPLDVIPIGSGDNAIMDLVLTEAGLLIFTSKNGENDGIWLLRGDPGDPSLELVRGGMGIRIDSIAQRQATIWPEIGGVVWVDDGGGIFRTNGNEVYRIDEYGPKKPLGSGRRDCAAAHGLYLFVSRQDRLLVMRAFDERGSWTALIGPNGTPTFSCQSLFKSEGSMYFVSDQGRVWRYSLEDQAPSERGMVEGNLVDLTITTQPVARDEYSRTRWRRVGVRSSSDSSGELRSITSYAGPRFATPEPLKYEEVINRAVEDRDDVVVPAHGPSPEMSVSVVFRGDVRVETVSIWASGRKDER